MTSVSNLAFIRAKSGSSERLRQGLLALVEPSRAEPGCISYEVHRSSDDADLWMLYENWQSAQDLAAHFASLHMQAFLKDAPSISQGDLDWRPFENHSPPSEIRMPPVADSAERFERGRAILRRIGGQDFEGPANRLAQISPDLARFMIEYPYGDVLSRAGLDLRVRQICTISSLIAQGSVQSQLKFHMSGLLNVGGLPQDLVEILFLATAILGFPAAINAIAIVRQIFSERRIAFVPAREVDTDGTDRYRRGMRSFCDLMPNSDLTDFVASLSEISPELAQWSIEFAFGDVLARAGLEAKVKQLAIVSMLATVGNRAEALRLHLVGALGCGATMAEVIEVLIQISVYAGFPSALNAFAVARAVFENRSASSKVDAVMRSDASHSEKNAVRRERGLAALAATSSASGEAVVRSFDDIAPDIGRMILEHSYGDIFHRPGITAKTRELTACAALASRGTVTTETPLRVHINAALTAGAGPTEVIETLLNVLPYAGYPAVQQAMHIAAEEFGKRGIESPGRARPAGTDWA
jgi:4-carboxymuconolactone decarboxylase